MAEEKRITREKLKKIKQVSAACCKEKNYRQMKGFVLEQRCILTV